MASASLQWSSTGEHKFGVALVVDNVTDSQYQPFPGTPATDRQVSLSATIKRQQLADPVEDVRREFIAVGLIEHFVASVGVYLD